MSECPTCGRKIRGDVCPYCDEEGLASGDIDSSPVSGESLVAVFGCNEERQADHAVSLLESEGIPAFQSLAEDVDDPAELADLDGDIIISVSEEDEDRAREIITAAEPEMGLDV
jgi:hypothetical protein